MNAKYHHGNLRTALIEAAIELVEEQGSEHFSLREAARRAGVSSGAPYRHFSDKDDLMREVARLTGARLAQSQAAILENATDPMTGFRAMGVANVVYAVEHPELYKLLTDKRWFDPNDPSVKDIVASHTRLQKAAVAGGEQQGLLNPAHEPALVMLAGHAISYGLARMILDGHFPELLAQEAEVLAESVLGFLGQGFRAPKKD
jgi:AcrR family transcriptional regulator